MNTGLKGKTLLITGGSGGIGRATALAFAREGVHVAIVDIDRAGAETVARDVKALGVKASVTIADLAKTGDAERGLDEAVKTLDGKVDILVNNIGIGFVRTFDEISDADWETIFQVNFMTYVRACRKILPLMRARKSGVIINNASDLGRQPEAVPIDYSSLKSAIIAMTKGLARAEGPTLRINAVAPGPVWTPFWTKPGGFAETMGKYHKMAPQDAVEHELKLRQLPLQRLGTPEEVANVIVFMASDLASFVTSAIWGVDGGSIRNIV
jgi:3-oxoacyl-[acyl-carrier protein] reductase